MPIHQANAQKLFSYGELQFSKDFIQLTCLIRNQGPSLFHSIYGIVQSAPNSISNFARAAVGEGPQIVEGVARDRFKLVVQLEEIPYFADQFEYYGPLFDGWDPDNCNITIGSEFVRSREQVCRLTGCHWI